MNHGMGKLRLSLILAYYRLSSELRCGRLLFVRAMIHVKRNFVLIFQSNEVFFIVETGYGRFLAIFHTWLETCVYTWVNIRARDLWTSILTK